MTQIAQLQSDTDEALMLSYGKGCQAAFAELYGRHKGPMYRYVCRQLGAKHQAKAQELFQEIWLRVIDNRVSYTVEAKFSTWLYRIAHNLSDPGTLRRLGTSLLASHRVWRCNPPVRPAGWHRAVFRPWDPENRSLVAFTHSGCGRRSENHFSSML